MLYRSPMIYKFRGTPDRPANAFLYQGKPISEGTAMHAVKLLVEARDAAGRHPADPMEALREVTAAITVPCRAVGVAKFELTHVLTRRGVRKPFDLAIAELCRPYRKEQSK